MPESPLAGIDIGTSSSKGVLATADGRVLATCVREHGLSLPHPGWAEHDAEAVWWADVCAIARELTAGTDEVAAVCVSGIGPCLLPADARSRPLRPAILYGIDTRATAEIRELSERLGADRILARGGSALSSRAVGPKLLWLARAEPGVWGATRRFFMASSYAVCRLTGEYVLDHHSPALSRGQPPTPAAWRPPARSPAGSASSPGEPRTRSCWARRRRFRPAPRASSSSPILPASGRRCSIRTPAE